MKYDSIQFNASNNGNHNSCIKFIGVENYRTSLEYFNVLTPDGVKEVKDMQFIVKVNNRFYVEDEV